MPIARDQHKIVLEHQGGDPQIVVGNWSPGAFELNEQSGIVFCRFVAGHQNAYGSFSQEFVQQDLVTALLRSSEEACLNLRKDDERDQDLIAGLELLGQLEIALKQIGQPVSVQRDPYFHFFGSIRR